MRTQQQPTVLTPLQTARRLAVEFAETAVERDEAGGTPKEQRDAIRQSGLLALSIPTQFGGLGASWSETLGVVREFAKVDSSIAHVFGFQHLMLATVRLFFAPRSVATLVRTDRPQELVLGQCTEPPGHPYRGQDL
nr:hypothetical protein GCM10020185_84950 [Pseudomonas brassicacearum subsp. brassicacearum]